MAISQNQIEQTRLDLGKSFLDLEPSAILELYELYFDVEQEPFRFHGGTNNLQTNIIWAGNSYFASAIQVEGFEANIMGRLPRPKVTVANVDYAISNILRDFSDFRNGKFIRIKTFLKHLDNENFDNNQNPFGVANSLAYISKEKYIISQKLIENKQVVQFELISPFDLESLETATRAIYGRYCYWQYRGMGCGYQGDVICQKDDKDFSVPPNSHIKDLNSNRFLADTYEKTLNLYKWKLNYSYKAGDVVCVDNLDLNGFKDPPNTFFVCIKNHISSSFITPNKSYDYWEMDACSKKINACKKRFVLDKFIGNSYISANDSSVVNKIMPFGGFPGTDKFKYE